MDAQNLGRFKGLLELKMGELTSLRKVSEQARAPVSLDQQSVGRVSRVDAMQQQAMAQAQERSRALELVQIEQALARIETQEYGYCLECDETIAPKRLEIDPAARLCIACAGRT